MLVRKRRQCDDGRCHARAVACPPHDVRFVPARLLLRTARIYLQLIHLLRRRRADGPISDEERAVTQRTRQAIETLRFRIHGTRAAQAVAAAYAMLGRLLVTAISVPDVGVYSNHSAISTPFSPPCIMGIGFLVPS